VFGKYGFKRQHLFSRSRPVRACNPEPASRSRRALSTVGEKFYRSKPFFQAGQIMVIRRKRARLPPLGVAADDNRRTPSFCVVGQQAVAILVWHPAAANWPGKGRRLPAGDFAAQRPRPVRSCCTVPRGSRLRPAVAEQRAPAGVGLRLPTLPAVALFDRRLRFAQLQKIVPAALYLPGSPAAAEGDHGVVDHPSESARRKVSFRRQVKPLIPWIRLTASSTVAKPVRKKC